MISIEIGFLSVIKIEFFSFDGTSGFSENRVRIIRRRTMVPVISVSHRASTSTPASAEAAASYRNGATAATADRTGATAADGSGATAAAVAAVAPTITRIGRIAAIDVMTAFGDFYG